MIAAVGSGIAAATSSLPAAAQTLDTLPPTNNGYLPVNGLEMYHEVYGADGVPLVLIHGAFPAIGTFLRRTSSAPRARPENRGARNARTWPHFRYRPAVEHQGHGLRCHRRAGCARNRAGRSLRLFDGREHAFQQSSGQSPRIGPNIFRPMIHTPIFSKPLFK